jgi:hypothetical protein
MNSSYDENKTLAKHLSEMKHADFRQFILIVLVVFAIGAALIWLSYRVKEGKFLDKDLEHFLLLEIGIAFITACVIAGTVEVFMRNRGERAQEQYKIEIAESVFKALFRTAIPDELVSEMYMALFVPKFVREEIEIKYRFEPLKVEPALPLDARKLRVRQVISFVARNVTDKTVNHSSAPREDILIADDDNVATPFKEFLMEIVSDNNPNGGPKIHLQDPQQLRAATTRQGMRYQLKTQTLYGVGPGQLVYVLLTIDKICRYADSDAWVTSYSAKRLKLTVEVVGNPLPDLEFWVDQSHRQKLVRVPESERQNASSYEWRLNFPILPYQGVMLRWRPRAIEVPTNPIAETGSEKSA